MDISPTLRAPAWGGAHANLPCELRGLIWLMSYFYVLILRSNSSIFLHHVRREASAYYYK